MSDKKVFCEECNYFTSFHYCGGGYDYCLAEENKIWKHNWQGIYYKLIRKPWKINKYNDCRWHRRNGGKRITIKPPI